MPCYESHNTLRTHVNSRPGVRTIARPFTASRLPPHRSPRCNALIGLERFFKGVSPASSQQPLFEVGGPELEPEFQQWLRREGLSTQPLLLRQCGREGRGLVANRALPRGEVLLRLPDSLVLTAERAMADSSLAPLLRSLSPAAAPTASPRDGGSAVVAAVQSQPAPPPDVALPLPEWSLLALLLAEVRGRLAAGDHSSRWSPYVAILPQRSGTVLDWPAKETKQLLQGSPLMRLATSITAAAATSWRELEPLLARGRAEGLVPEHVTLGKADLYWAFGVLLSRCIRLPGRGDLQVLAPWADLLNHDMAAEPSCHLDWDCKLEAQRVQGEGSTTTTTTRGSLVLRADRDYSVGQQIYVSYGPKSSGELLLSYGFCPPPAANPHQDYKLYLAVKHASDPLAQLKVQALARHGLPAELEFPLRLEGLPEGLLQYLALIEARPAVAQEVFELASLLFKEGTFPLLDGQDTLALALRALSNRCTAALKEYPTSMEADQVLAAGGVAAISGSGGGEQVHWPRLPPAGTSSSQVSPEQQQQQLTMGTDDVIVSSLRAAAVAGIRVRERLILQRTQAAAAQQLTEVRRSVARTRRR